jgi:hypothetical protein
VSYKRTALAAAAARWAEDFNVSMFNKTLRAQREILWLSPDIIVHQNRNVDLQRAARIAFRRGRAYASARLKTSTLGQRILYTVFCPLLPIVLVRRLVKNIQGKKLYYKRTLRTLPLILIFVFLWSWGEFQIQLTGQDNISLSLSEE